MSFYIKKIIHTEIDEKGEGNYTEVLTLYHPEHIESDEGQDDFFEKCLESIIIDDVDFSSWESKNHILTVIGSDRDLGHPDDLENANHYLREEYNDYVVVNEGLDFYSKVYMNGEQQSYETMKNDLIWLLNAYIPSQHENYGMNIGDFHKKCEEIRTRNGLPTIEKK